MKCICNLISKLTLSTLTNAGVLVLVGAMVMMVVRITGVSICNTERNQILEDSLLKAKDSLTLQPNDSTICNNTCVLISENEFERMVKMKGIESNDYLAIILTLLTLCVSLSAVIPYIVGKSVTNHQVTKTVETILKEQKIENERNYRDAIEQLEGAEAHLSRMISYSLLYDVQSIDFAEDIKDNESKLDPRAHPFWAIGWAAKAMIRYVKIAPMFHTKNFVTYCVDYILLSSKMIEKIKVTENLLKDANLDFKNKVLRAFIDLFDAMGFYYSYESNDRLGFKLDKVKELDQLNTTLASLYDKLIKGKDKGKVQGCGLNPGDVALEVAKKSKYCVYLSDASRFNEYFNHWVNNKDNDNRFPRKFYR